MPQTATYRVIPLADLVTAETLALLEQALGPSAGLLLFAGHYGSGKSTVAVGAAHAAEQRGRPVVVVCEHSDRFLTGLAVPASWRVSITGPSSAEWAAALGAIDEGPGPVVVVSSLSHENAAAVLDASARVSVIAPVETPLIGIDVIYSLGQLGLDQAATVKVLRCLHSQYLLNALCPACREPVSLRREEVDEIVPGARTTMDAWSELGCAECAGTGTKGRIAVSETILIDDTTRSAVAEAALTYKMPALPTSHYRSLQEAAREHLLNGEVGLKTFRREIAANPMLRATHALERERVALRTTRQLFRRFVDDAVIATIAAGDEVASTARRADATCLFCDIRGFTSFAEQHEPQHVFRILNRLVDEVIALVITHGGTIDKLVGDSVMALFGLPAYKPDHALRAASCAIAIQKRITALGVVNPEIAALKVGIGINSGELAVGFLGNEQRMEYTVLGDVVNTAARLESIALPGQILLGPSTRHRLGKAMKTRDLGEVTLKGKAARVRLCELLPD